MNKVKDINSKEEKLKRRAKILEKHKKKPIMTFFSSEMLEYKIFYNFIERWKMNE